MHLGQRSARGRIAVGTEVGEVGAVDAADERQLVFDECGLPLLRPDEGQATHAGALALMLALAHGGTADERAAVASALAQRDRAAAFDLPSASPRLRGALAAAANAGGPFNTAVAAQAARRASTFALMPLS